MTDDNKSKSEKRENNGNITLELDEAERTKDKIQTQPQGRFQDLKQDLERRSRKANFWLQVIGIVVVGAYTTIAAFQWCEMRETNRITLEALKISEGAALLLANISFDDSYGVITYSFNNTGHRTAEVMKEQLDEAIIARPTNIPIEHTQVEIDEAIEIAPGIQTVGAGQFTIQKWQPVEMKAIRDTTHTIIFGGSITYSDGLGKFAQTVKYSFCLASYVFATTHELQWTPCNHETLIQVMNSPITFRKTINKYGQ